MTARFTLGPATFLDSASARVVAQEVIRDDCYQIGRVPIGSIVIDVGAFGGEFAILAALTRDAVAVACEPAPANMRTLCANIEINGVGDRIWAREIAVADEDGYRDFAYRANHPAGSLWFADAQRYGIDGYEIHSVRTMRMARVIDDALQRWPGRPVVVKLDCEGAEVEIFCDPDLEWLRLVHVVTMEWHSRDGHIYRKMLERRGFTHTELTGSGRINGLVPSYEPGMSGGMVFAIRASS